MQELQKYAKFLANIREFFSMQYIVEVETKSLLNYPTLDENIDSVKVVVNQKFKQKKYYLHTSPELEMKKLLASGSGDIYQICKVYRDNEIGKHNFNEFSMLEYYIMDIDERQLSENVVKLLNFVGISGEIVRFSYNEIFQKFAKFDINANFNDLKNFAKSHNLSTNFANIQDLQMLLFVHFVECNLKQFEICIIYDYPSNQSGLAQIEGKVSKRVKFGSATFEVKIGQQLAQSEIEYYKEIGVYHEMFSTSPCAMPEPTP